MQRMLFILSYTAVLAALLGSGCVMAEPLGPEVVIRYSEFGAKGDGQTDDLDALVAAHAHANEYNLPVRADDGATYFLGGGDRLIVIQTDTNFGDAHFVIDDRNVDNRSANLFEVRSNLEPLEIEGLVTLKRDQARLPVVLPQDSLVIVTNDHVRQYIRRGLNANKGKAQTDVFLADRSGRIDPDTPILWDFDQITDLYVLPIDSKPLTIKGGHFTTIANVAESKYTYYSRGLAVRRSNVVIDVLEHYVTGEGEQGAPYAGFLNIARCAYVTVQGCVLTGRKTYRTIGRAGKPVSMGSYDLSINQASHVRIIETTQTNDINDLRNWGIMASNYSKNLEYQGCELSRFDAHMGVYNAKIKDSILGHAGINLIGKGTFLMEDSTTSGRSLVNLRNDYGSTWEGDLIIRNCALIPHAGRPGNVYLITGYNDGQHDFGYPCFMPHAITIDSLHIDDTNAPDGYRGPAVFADFNRQLRYADIDQPFPYEVTHAVRLNNITTASGLPLRMSDNIFMFRALEVQGID